MTVNFTTWKGITDGQTYGIPDSVVLLDDWADNQLTSNREDYQTTSFTGSDSTLVEQGASGSLSRPEWTVDNGSPSVSNAELTVNSEDRLRTPLSLTTLDNTTWEFKISDVQNLESNGYVSLVANSTTYRESVQNLQDGYFVFIGDSNLALVEDSAGSTTSLIEKGESPPNEPFVCRVERDASGNWELFIDNVSVGTATDTTHTTSDRISLATATTGGGGYNFDWFAIDQSD